MNRRSHDQPKHRRRFVQELKLSAYAATGCTLAAVDASAGIIYTDLGQNGVTVRDGTFDVDMNADGLVDFLVLHRQSFWDTSTSPTNPSHDSNSARSVVAFVGRSYTGWSRGIANTAAGQAAKAIRIGESILPDTANLRLGLIAVSASTGTGWTTRGEFLGLTERGFLGVSFGRVGELRNAGWIEVEAAYPDDFTIYGFAYESTLGKPIAAGAVPEPPSLVLLAAGAAGLAVLRRKRTKNCAREGNARLETVQPRETDA